VREEEKRERHRKERKTLKNQVKQDKIELGSQNGYKAPKTGVEQSDRSTKIMGQQAS
jgi:hypothetical protein